MKEKLPEGNAWEECAGNARPFGRLHVQLPEKPVAECVEGLCFEWRDLALRAS